METFVTLGLVLKETRYKESDRILTILTPGLGVISASAQSSLRLKSKLFSACGLFCYSEFTLVPGRSLKRSTTTAMPCGISSRMNSRAFSRMTSATSSFSCISV